MIDPALRAARIAMLSMGCIGRAILVVQMSRAGIRFVLCRPQHPGNIGSAARAIKTMGFGDLRLVAPERYPAPEAQWMATNAGDVLERVKIYEELKPAIQDCVTTFAMSARGREWSPQV